MAVVKNGTSRTDIKAYMLEQIAPKYFDDIDINDINVGLFGYINEILADTTNDVYFMMASLYKESFPHLAELPESIYNHALIYQLSNIFASPAKVNFTILIPEESILNNGTVTSSYQYFDIDSNMNFNIGNLPFMMDYDVRIISKNTTNGWLHSAQYIMDHENTISELKNPYIRTNIYLGDNGRRYIMLAVLLHQVSKKVITDTILSNEDLNLVTMKYSFNNTLANFEVYYKEPGNLSYIQLKKKLVNTNPEDEPFCFYKLADEGLLQIEFSGDDRYFQPSYNSEIIVEIFTTLGSAGNFEVYEGDDVQVIGKYDKYANNRGVVFMGSVVGSSYGGKDTMNIERLQKETVKSYSTIKSFTTTNDLNLYFTQILEENSMNSKILFMKKRDDAFERLYSAFILFRDSDNNVIPTNTLDMIVKPDDVDFSLVQTARNVLKAGKILRYYGDNEDPYAGIDNNLTLSNELDQYEGTNEFIYINPFLTIISTNPLGVGFYLNTINQTVLLDSINLSNTSFYQFIIDSFDIIRNAVFGDDKYIFKMNLIPHTRLPKEAFKIIRDDTYVEDINDVFNNPTDGYNYLRNNNLKVFLEIFGKENERKMYIELKLVGFDSEKYFFEGNITTNDYISKEGYIQITDGFRNPETLSDVIENPVLIPATDCMINVHAFYLYPDGTKIGSSVFDNFDELKEFTLTNSYSLSENSLANFIIPVKEIKSYVEYLVRDINGKYGFRLNSIPMIKANYLNLKGNTGEAFYKNFTKMYEYIADAMDKLTNNFTVDLKFFNTYGASNHYHLVGEEGQIDRVNISLRFKVKFTTTQNLDLAVKEVEEYIKGLVEQTKLSLVSSPSFYASNIISKCMEKFPAILYMDFKGINSYGPAYQSLESDVNEANVIQGIIETSNVIPEYLNIDGIIKEGNKTFMVKVELAT